MTRAFIAALVVSVLAALPGAADAASGKLERRTYGTGYRSLIYTPASVTPRRPAPLFVMVHGCGTTAEQQMGANGLNAQARRDRFVVLYPDHEGDRVRHPLRCWRFDADTRRGSRDPAAIAGMVRDALARRSPRIDRRRVYVAGMSSGAMMTAVLGATYPDLFAAIMMHAGCAFRAATSLLPAPGGSACVTAGPTRPTDVLAREARRAMGRRARVVPTLVTHGDADRTIPFAHSGQVLDQWRRTDNLVATGTLTAPIAAAPLTRRTVAAPGRYRSTVTTFGPRRGCTVLERWAIHGMDHFWPGGSTAPAFAPFTDPRGPDGGEIAWGFFRRFRLGRLPDGCPGRVGGDARRPRSGR